MCAPCLRAGKRRKLVQFDLYPGGPVINAWSVSGQRVWAEWTDGPDGEEKIHLRCGCGHTPQIRRERMTAALGAIERGEFARRIREIPL
jgi:hypothetical protein